MLSAISGDGDIAASIFVATIAAWTAVALGASLCNVGSRFKDSATRTLAAAAGLLALAPFFPPTIALMSAIALGLHAIVTAIMRLADVLAANDGA